MIASFQIPCSSMEANYQNSVIVQILLNTSELTLICLRAQVLHSTMQRPFQRWRRGRWGGRVPQRGRRKVVVEVVQHLATVPGPAHSGWLTITGVHAQRRPISWGEVTSGQAQAQRRAQVEQATPSHPLPALVDFLTVGRQDEGVIPHPQAPTSALMEECKFIGVQWRCADIKKTKHWHQSIMLMKTGSHVSSWYGGRRGQELDQYFH